MSEEKSPSNATDPGLVTAATSCSAIWLDGYCVTIERGNRWLADTQGRLWATDFHANRGHWPTTEAALAALDKWLDENKDDLACARLRQNVAGEATASKKGTKL
jgi:hypothetical protein